MIDLLWYRLRPSRVQAGVCAKCSPKCCPIAAAAAADGSRPAPKPWPPGLPAVKKGSSQKAQLDSLCPPAKEGDTHLVVVCSTYTTLIPFFTRGGFSIIPCSSLFPTCGPQVSWPAVPVSCSAPFDKSFFVLRPFSTPGTARCEHAASFAPRPIPLGQRSDLAYILFY